MRVGLANGCFDLFHEGHARFLWEAKKYCDWLIVGVNTDESIRRAKGPSRPYDLLRYRMNEVSRYADLTVSFDGDSRDLIREFQPGIVIRGGDQRFDVEAPAVVFLPRFGEVSTSMLGRRLFREGKL